MKEDIEMTNEYLRKNLIANEEEKEKAIELYNDKKRMKDSLIELNYQLGITKSITADLEEKEKIEQKISAIVLLEVENEYIKERYKELEVITNGIKVLETNGVNDDTFYVIAKTDFLKGSYKHLLDDYIPKSKVEKIIKELKTEKNKHTDYYFNIQEVIRILSRLLESGD